MFGTTRRRRRNGHSMLELGATAVVAYGTFQLARWAVSRLLRDRDQDLQLKHEVTQTLNQSFPSPQLQVDKQRVATLMIKSMPGIKTMTEEATDCSYEVRQLKVLRKQSTEESRQEEQQMWNLMKRKSITRYLGMVYIHNAFLLIHILQTKYDDDLDAECSLDDDLQKNFPPQLFQLIEQAIDRRLQYWNVMQILDISHDEFVAGLSAVRWNVESSLFKILIQDFEDKNHLSVVLQSPECQLLWRQLNNNFFEFADAQVVRPIFVDQSVKTLIASLRGLKECFTVFTPENETYLSLLESELSSPLTTRSLFQSIDQLD